jgi:hypothetical protein
MIVGGKIIKDWDKSQISTAYHKYYEDKDV